MKAAKAVRPWHRPFFGGTAPASGRGSQKRSCAQAAPCEGCSEFEARGGRCRQETEYAGLEMPA